MKLQLQPSYTRKSEWMTLAEEEGFTFEVSELSIPQQNGKKRQEMVEWYRSCGLVTSLHGAFIDNNPVSNEPDIARVSRALMEESCELAVYLNAENIVFHAASFPFLRSTYLDNWVEEASCYFLELAEKYDLKFFIENSTDRDPEPIYRLMKACNSKRIRTCLDIGHVNYSREPQQNWFHRLEEYIDYIHLSDNFGGFDDHLPLGVGSVPWKLVNDLCQSIDQEREILVTLETGDLEPTLGSIDFLREREFFIWDQSREQTNHFSVRGVSEEEKKRIFAVRNEQKKEALQERNHQLWSGLQRYLSSHIVDTIVNDPQGLSLGGEKMHTTMLMSDLHAFTAVTEGMEAEYMLQMLNHYYAEMHEIIHRYNGTIIDMIGDGLLVAFGLFGDGEQAADLACAAAIEMVSRMETVNDWNEAQGFPRVHMGIGINTGDVVAGNVGSDIHIKYGLVGSHVNFCSRFESYTNNEQILISEETLRECRAPLEVRQKITVFPKGAKKEIPLYDVIGIGRPYERYYKQQESLEQKLKKPVCITFRLAEGKHMANDVHRGFLTKLSKDGGVFQTEVPLERYDSLRIDTEMDDFIFCRVGESEEDGIRLYFTSVPDSFERWYQKQTEK